MSRPPQLPDSPAMPVLPNEPNPNPGHSSLLARVADTVQRYRMFEPGDHVAVAVSGGADSVCLLHLLLELAPAMDLHLSVIHLNHQLRGDESRQDEQFVRDLAARVNLPASIRSVDLAASSGNLEQAARDARLAFFREQLSTGAVRRIALGHTRNDQAETVLFRFLRGAGGAGLAAIRPVTSDGVVRPLIESTRADIELYLRQRGIAWREDSSNTSLQFARNRIRHHLLPQLAREWNPAIDETLSRAADWALAEEEFWESEVRRLSSGHMEERDGAILIPVDWLAGLPLAVGRRVVRHAFQKVKGDLRGIDFGHIAAVLKLASFREGRGRTQAPGVEVTRSFNWVRFAKFPREPEPFPCYQLAATVPGRVRIPGTKNAISLELIEKGETPAPADCVYNRETSCVDWRFLSDPLEVRSWMAGDRYQPFGTTGEEKIKTLFQKARIPQWERCQWPIMTAGSAIVWARQFGPAARFVADADCAVVLRIREVTAS